jgi:hypothetical protein
MIIASNIDVTKIDKNALYKGKKGTYLSITLLENRDGEDQYGNHFMCVQDLGKEARQRGEKGPILGNAKIVVHDRPEGAGGGNQMPRDNRIDDSDMPF